MNTIKIEFSEWEWEEGRSQKSSNESAFNRRSGQTEFEVSPEHLTSYEENMKWESEQILLCLNEVRKRKFFAINASSILFPGLIGGFVATATYLEKAGFGASNDHGFYWVSAVIVAMFIGMANMIAIKYISAFKSQANLLIRQLNCLRQALDSITYYKFEGKYPIHLLSLVQGGVYYKIFGKHRKLPIGNDSFRNRLIGSYSESADKSLIGFLFVSSSTLIASPFIYLIAVSTNNWASLEASNMTLFDSKSEAVLCTLAVILLSFSVFVFGHWEGFKKLRTADSPLLKSESSTKAPDILFEYTKTDCFAILSLGIVSVYWAYLGWNSSSAIFNQIITVLSGVGFIIFLVCLSKVFFDSLNRIHRSLTFKASFNINVNKPNKSN